ncbi:MAG: NTP transferase domain-containing protein, partial [Thermoplasmatales archaeon]
CGEPMILRIYRVLSSCEFFDNVIVYSKYQELPLAEVKIIRDLSSGVLLDALISALESFGEFLAVGGDMPYLTCRTVSLLMNNYDGIPVAAADYSGFPQPLFAIYNRNIYVELKAYSLHERRIYPFLHRYFKIINLGEEESSNILSVNTQEELAEARRRIKCGEI